jgi:hypothetical protein
MSAIGHWVGRTVDEAARASRAFGRDCRLAGRGMAQRAGRTYRLGCLSPFARDVPFNVAFFAELRRRGFIEGQNLTIDFRAFAPHLDLI